MPIKNFLHRIVNGLTVAAFLYLFTVFFSLAEKQMQADALKEQLNKQSQVVRLAEAKNE